MLKDARLVKKIGRMTPRGVIMLSLGLAKMHMDAGMTMNDLDEIITIAEEQAKELGDKHGKTSAKR